MLITFILSAVRTEESSERNAAASLENHPPGAPDVFDTTSDCALSVSAAVPVRSHQLPGCPRRVGTSAEWRETSRDEDREVADSRGAIYFRASPSAVKQQQQILHHHTRTSHHIDAVSQYGNLSVLVHSHW
ncbi:hypothetical protein NQZ68_003023 [Dissostichus eleginoides]|nr:hypothetical protein NQZ68_003023 [Dissostichus eleginoides]